MFEFVNTFRLDYTALTPEQFSYYKTVGMWIVAIIPILIFICFHFVNKRNSLAVLSNLEKAKGVKHIVEAKIVPMILFMYFLSLCAIEKILPFLLFSNTGTFLEFCAKQGDIQGGKMGLVAVIVAYIFSTLAIFYLQGRRIVFTNNDITIFNANILFSAFDFEIPYSEILDVMRSTNRMPRELWVVTKDKKSTFHCIKNIDKTVEILKNCMGK